MTEINLKMKILNGIFGVCRLESTALIPNWIDSGKFYSITKTPDELSIVCSQENIPEEIKCEKDWKIIKIEGPLDFSLIGILSTISETLAKEGISVFAISTYDTDYILVKNKDIEVAKNALRKKGHKIDN